MITNYHVCDFNRIRWGCQLKKRDVRMNDRTPSLGVAWDTNCLKVPPVPPPAESPVRDRRPPVGHWRHFSDPRHSKLGNAVAKGPAEEFKGRGRREDEFNAGADPGRWKGGIGDETGEADGAATKRPGRRIDPACRTSARRLLGSHSCRALSFRRREC